MTKIAIVSSVLPATNYSAYLAEALQRKCSRKLKVWIYTSKEKDNLRSPLKNLQLVWDKTFFYPFQILLQTLREKPTIIHLQHEINMFGGLVTAAIFPLLLFLLRLIKVKIVVTIHAVVSKEEINERFLRTFLQSGQKLPLVLVRLFFSVLYRTIGFFPTKIIVHSPGLKSILVENYQLREKKIDVIPHGVPDAIQISRNYQPSCEWIEALADRQFILSYGYLHRRKGIERLLVAFGEIAKKHPKLVLVIAGGTLQKDYEQRLKRMVQKLGLKKRVVFTGFAKEPDLRWLLAKCQLVLLPARYSIAASGPLAQIIAHHKPLIASKVGVFREEIREEVDGLLASNSAQAWTRQTERLLSDKQLYDKITLNLRRKQQARCWSKIAERTYCLYQDISEK